MNIVWLTGVHSGLSAIVGAMFMSIRPHFLIHGYASEHDFAIIDTIYSAFSLAPVCLLCVLGTYYKLKIKHIQLYIIAFAIATLLAFAFIILFAIHDTHLLFIMAALVGTFNWAESYFLLFLYVESLTVEKTFWLWSLFNIVGAIIGRYVFLPFIIVWNTDGCAYALFTLMLLYCILFVLYLLTTIPNTCTYTNPNTTTNIRKHSCKYALILCICLLTTGADDAFNSWQGAYYIEAFNTSDTISLIMCLISDIGQILGVFLFQQLHVRFDPSIVAAAACVFTVAGFISFSFTSFVINIILAIALKCILIGIENSVYLNILRCTQEVGNAFIVLYFASLQFNFIVSSVPFVALFDAENVQWLFFYISLSVYEFVSLFLIIYIFLIIR